MSRLIGLYAQVIARCYDTFVTELPVLIFGGTFDPLHRAHVELPFLVRDELECTHVRYVPAAMNPLKKDRPTPADHRINMLRLALAEPIERGEALIDTRELGRPGPSYTVDTLESLHADLATQTPAEIYLLIGSDAAIGFGQWRSPQRILELATPAVMVRPELDREAFCTALATRPNPIQSEEWWMNRVVGTPLRDICATEIRRRLSAGEATGNLLPRPVEQYIREHGLYGTTGTAAAT